MTWQRGCRCRPKGSHPYGNADIPLTPAVTVHPTRGFQSHTSHSDPAGTICRGTRFPPPREAGSPNPEPRPPLSAGSLGGLVPAGRKVASSTRPFDCTLSPLPPRLRYYPNIVTSVRRTWLSVPRSLSVLSRALQDLPLFLPGA